MCVLKFLHTIIGIGIREDLGETNINERFYCIHTNITYLNKEVDEIGIRLEFGADGAQELDLLRLGGSRLNLTARSD